MIGHACPLGAENQSTLTKEPGFVGHDKNMPIAEAEQFDIALQAKGKALRKPATVSIRSPAR